MDRLTLYAAALLVLAASWEFARRMVGVQNFMTWWPVAWASILLLHYFRPFGVYAASFQALGVVVVGVVSFGLGGLLGQTTPRSTYFRPSSRVTVHPQLGGGRFVAVFGTLIVLFAFGYLSFRRGIEAVMGKSLAELSAIEVRYAQNYVEGSAGPAVLLFSLAAVVACGSVVAGRHFGRVWYALLAGVLFFVGQSPSRTHLLSVVTTTAAFAWLTRERGSARTGPEHPKHHSGRKGRRSFGFVVAVSVVLTLGLAYFVLVGNLLRKGLSSPASGGSVVSGWLESPVLYLTGGLSALTVGIERGESTLFSSGKSVYVLVRTLGFIVPSVEAPSTISPFVDIPMPFNVYTGFGDLWFDTGWLGLVLVSGLFGVVTGWALTRSVGGRYSSGFIASAMIAIAASTPLTLRLLNLDSVFVLLCGGLAFLIIEGRGSPEVHLVNRTHAGTSSRIPL